MPQLILGALYYTGKGITQDRKEATKWQRKAAEQGLVEAQFGLGGLYRYGLGVAQDYVVGNG